MTSEFYDEEADALLRQFEDAVVIRRHRGGRYDIKVDKLADRSFYWHLFCDGERVNGGLGDTYLDAYRDALSAVNSHEYREDG